MRRSSAPAGAACARAAPHSRVGLRSACLPRTEAPPRRRGAEVAPLYGEDMPTEDRPDYAAQRAHTRRLLEQKIDALPDAHRVVFILRALEEFSVEETAAALRLPEA